MAYDENNSRENIYSTKVRAGKRRTYFFDVRKTKGEDYYITITESTRKFNDGGYERHKIFIYKEDFNRFLNSLNDVMDHVKKELMPDFDYEMYERRQAEWEAQQLAEEAEGGSESSATEGAIESTTEDTTETVVEETPTETDQPTTNTSDAEGIDDEISW